MRSRAPGHDDGVTPALPAQASAVGPAALRRDTQRRLPAQPCAAGHRRRAASQRQRASRHAEVRRASLCLVSSAGPHTALCAGSVWPMARQVTRKRARPAGHFRCDDHQGCDCPGPGTSPAGACSRTRTPALPPPRSWPSSPRWSGSLGPPLRRASSAPKTKRTCRALFMSSPMHSVGEDCTRWACHRHQLRKYTSELGCPSVHERPQARLLSTCLKSCLSTHSEQNLFQRSLQCPRRALGVHTGTSVHASYARPRPPVRGGQPFGPPTRCTQSGRRRVLVPVHWLLQRTMVFRPEGNFSTLLATLGNAGTRLALHHIATMET